MLNILTRKTNGQSLTEYGLGISLVLIIAVGALISLSSNVNLGITGILSDKPQAAAPPTVGLPAATTTTAPSFSLPGSIPNQQASLCGANGKCTAQQMNNTVQVAGANGMGNTQAQADVLSSLANQLASLPDTDPGLMSLITQLANSGHKIAGYEAQGSGAYIDFNFEGDNYQALHDQLASYLASNPDALPASMNQQLSQAADWISSHVSEMSWSDNFGPNGENDWSTYQNAWSDVQNKTTKTAQQSNRVCQNGGDTTQCVK